MEKRLLSRKRFILEKVDSKSTSQTDFMFKSFFKRIRSSLFTHVMKDNLKVFFFFFGAAYLTCFISPVKIKHHNR